jgi:hypothetical protein
MVALQPSLMPPQTLVPQASAIVFGLQTHLLAVHALLAQSEGAMQFLPMIHALHDPPPQSTSVSRAFSILSVQDGSGGSEHTMLAGQ